MSHDDSEPICFLNGAIRPATDAHIPINDLGFIHGVTVSEQLRTFRGRPFLLAEHLQRFKRGLKLLQIDLPELEGLNSAVEAVAAHNYRLHGNNQELGICLFGTPGPSPRFKYSNKLNQEFRPTVCVHTYALPFAEMHERYQNGVQLKLASTTEIPPSCWPKEVKIRSRLHYFLADLEMLNTFPDCIAILTDAIESSTNRFFRETSTSTPIFVFNENEITVPPAEQILRSVSLDFLLAIGRELNFKIVRREVSTSEIENLRSMFLVSTPFCIYDVGSIESHPLKMHSAELSQLKAQWKKIVDFDFEWQS